MRGSTRWLLSAVAATPGAISAASAQPTLERNDTDAQTLDFTSVEPAPEETVLAPHLGQLGTTASQLPIASVHVAPPSQGGVARWRSTRAPEEFELEFEQSDLLDAAWVERQFQARGMTTGAPIEPDRVVSLVQQINRAFLENGYVNSGVRIDSFDPETNTLALSLISGRISEPLTLEWDGDSEGLDDSYVLDRLPAIRQAPFNLADMELQFRTLAADPAIRTVNASVEPTADVGVARLHPLRVAAPPRSDLYVSLVNSRSPSVGGERAAIGGSIRNIAFSGSTLSAEYGVTEGLSDATLSFSTPTITPRLSFDLRAEINEAAVVDPALRTLDITSESATQEAGLTYRLIERPLMPGARAGDWRSARAVSIGARLGRKVSETFLLGMPFSFSPGAKDGRTEITVARLSADWIDRDNEAGRGRVWALSVTSTLGLEGTQSGPGVPNPSENFASVFLQANHARQLTQSGLELRTRLAGQWSSGLLYSSERFAVGGANTVRGYRENLVLADQGVLGSVELSRSFSLSGGRRNHNGTDWGAFRGAVFADAAAVRNEGAGEPDPETLSSVGVSVAWTPSPSVNVQLAYARALTESPNRDEDDLQDRGIHFRITVRPLAWFNDW